MICKKCGAKIQKDSFFCDNCGQSIGTVAELVEFNRKERQKKRQRRTVTLAVLILAAICAYIAVRAIGGSDTVNLPSQTAVPTMQPSAAPTPEAVIAEQSPVETQSPESATVPSAAPTQKPKPTAKPAQTPLAVQTPSQPPIQPTSSDYMYPSDTTVLTDEFLNSLSRSEARIVRNELYARYGLKFKTNDMQQHFASKTWYKPNAGISTVAIHSMFNSVERTNYQKIIAFEKRKGWIK